MKRPVQILISLIAISVNIYGQACCTAGTPLLGSLEMSTSAKGSWQFGLTYEYNLLTNVYSGSNELIDNTRERLTQAVLTEVSYGLTNRITLTGMFSFVNQNRKINPIIGQANEVDVNGIGDAIFLIKYSLMQLDIISETELAIGAGVKAPLGKSAIESGGVLLPADMQPGTGSWDGVLWGYFTKGRLFNLPLNLVSNISYRFNTNNDRFGANREGYRFGNELIAALGLGYRTDLPVDFSLMIRYRNTSPDKFADRDIPNTGGNWLNIVPGINYKVLENLTARLSGQLPVYRNLTGTQLTTTFTTSISLFYTISGGINF